MEKYKVEYGKTTVEVSSIDMTGAIIEAFKIEPPKSLGFAIIVSKVGEEEYNPFAISSKYIIELLNLPFIDTEKEEQERQPIKKSWLKRIFA